MCCCIGRECRPVQIAASLQNLCCRLRDPDKKNHEADAAFLNEKPTVSTTEAVKSTVRVEELR